MNAAAPGGAIEPLILVVDDDAGSRKAMALTLQTDGRRVEEFGDAASALSRALEDPSVALVVTDLKMPGKTGLDLAQDLAAARPDVSVLLTTAFGDVDTLLQARALGTVDYVAKPIARDDLRLRAPHLGRRECGGHETGGQQPVNVTHQKRCRTRKSSANDWSSFLDNTHDSCSF